MSSGRNVGQVERWASAFGGAALAVYGIRQRSLARRDDCRQRRHALIARGATGYCPMYAGPGSKHGIDRNTKVALAGSRGCLWNMPPPVNRPG